MDKDQWKLVHFGNILTKSCFRGYTRDTDRVFWWFDVSRSILVNFWEDFLRTLKNLWAENKFKAAIFCYLIATTLLGIVQSLIWIYSAITWASPYMLPSTWKEMKAVNYVKDSYSKSELVHIEYIKPISFSKIEDGYSVKYEARIKLDWKNNLREIREYIWEVTVSFDSSWKESIKYSENYICPNKEQKRLISWIEECY